MLSSIHPLGERTRHQRWWLTVTAYLVGSTVAAAALGAGLGAIGDLLRPGVIGDTAALIVLAVVAGAGLAHDLAPGGFHLPTPRRQVDENWLGSFRGWVYGVGYGFQLGLGVTTIITSGLVYVMWAAALLSGGVAGGLAIGATFGVVRGGAVFAMARVGTPEQLRAAHRRLDELRPAARTLSVATLSVGAVATLAAAMAV